MMPSYNKLSDLPWKSQGDTEVAEVTIAKGEHAPSVTSTKNPLRPGPASLRYVRHADGGIDLHERD